MFNPASNTVKPPKTDAQLEVEQARFDRRMALDHAVDLAKAGASKYGSAGYTSATLLTYAADITAFIKDGTIPTELPAIVAKLKETDPAGAPGPETREYLLSDKDIDTKPIKRVRKATRS